MKRLGTLAALALITQLPEAAAISGPPPASWYVLSMGVTWFLLISFSLTAVCIVCWIVQRLRRTKEDTLYPYVCSAGIVGVIVALASVWPFFTLIQDYFVIDAILLGSIGIVGVAAWLCVSVFLVWWIFRKRTTRRNNNTPPVTNAYSFVRLAGITGLLLITGAISLGALHSTEWLLTVTFFLFQSFVMLCFLVLFTSILSAIVHKLQPQKATSSLIEKMSKIANLAGFAVVGVFICSFTIAMVYGDGFTLGPVFFFFTGAVLAVFAILAFFVVITPPLPKAVQKRVTRSGLVAAGVIILSYTVAAVTNNSDFYLTLYYSASSSLVFFATLSFFGVPTLLTKKVTHKLFR